MVLDLECLEWSAESSAPPSSARKKKDRRSIDQVRLDLVVSPTDDYHRTYWLQLGELRRTRPEKAALRPRWQELQAELELVTGQMEQLGETETLEQPQGATWLEFRRRWEAARGEMGAMKDYLRVFASSLPGSKQST